MARPSARHGPRPVLIGLAGLAVLSALAFLGFKTPWIVVLAAMIGNLAVGTGETGPFLSLEQVILARATSKDRLGSVMSSYNVVGYVAAALGAALVSYWAMTAQVLFGVFLVGGLAQIVAYVLTEPGSSAPLPEHRAGGLPSRPLIRRLAALFALDSFAGGLVIQSLVVYWFHTHFGLGLASLGWIAFGTQVLSGLSLLLAPPLARRFGLVPTMVFSHLVSNCFLIALALAPTVAVAVSLLLARHLLSQIDVPTRQTFLMLAVEDHERETAAVVTNTSRTLVQAVSPALTGWVMQVISLSAPFIVGGGLKIAYDIMLYAAVRNVRHK
ncbi:MAG TPA: MFS transporter [Nitrospiria bacterium]|nr:MFS transporter [Nitrospiria bacterium]